MLCNICQKQPVYCTDHNPNTQELRGKLCVKCKALINFLESSVEYRHNFLSYCVRTGRIDRELADRLNEAFESQ